MTANSENTTTNYRAIVIVPADIKSRKFNPENDDKLYIGLDYDSTKYLCDSAGYICDNIMDSSYAIPQTVAKELGGVLLTEDEYVELLNDTDGYDVLTLIPGRYSLECWGDVYHGDDTLHLAELASGLGVYLRD